MNQIGSVQTMKKGKQANYVEILERVYKGNKLLQHALQSVLRRMLQHAVQPVTDVFFH